MFYTPESNTHFRFPPGWRTSDNFYMHRTATFSGQANRTTFLNFIHIFILDYHSLASTFYLFSSIVYRFIKTICWYFFKPFPPNLRFVISICTQYILYILVLLSSEIFTIKCNLQKRCKKLFFSTSKYIKLPYGKMKTQTQTENDFLLNFFIQCS